MFARFKRQQNKVINKGFTLVEMIVILALMAIMMGVAAFGILGWVDWATFRKENAAAEDIFYAAQNQLTELDSSGALYRRVTSILEADPNYNDDILLAKGTNVFQSGSYFSQLTDSNGNPYVWNDLWLTKNNNNQYRTIVRLTVDRGTYTKYTNGESVSNSAKVLFELVASYVSDKSVLDGAISIEFSPEAGQVLAVCYSSKAEELTYASSSSTSTTLSVLNREIHVREDIMLGYFGVDTMTTKNRGRGDKPQDCTLELENGAALLMSLQKNNYNFSDLGDSDMVTFTIYGSKSYDGSYTKLMKFTVTGTDLKDSASVYDIATAGNNPVTLSDVRIFNGMYRVSENDEGDPTDFRFPIWVEDGKLFVALDAVDIQAQSLVYAEANSLIEGADATDAQNRFRNTYSFYRFGFSDINYINCSAEINISGEDSQVNGQRHDSMAGEYSNSKGAIHGERTTFANDDGNSFYKDSSDADVYSPYVIKNSRHLYNMRFETDYDTPIVDTNSGDTVEEAKTFVLADNVDWNDLLEFRRNSNESAKNYLLNSYDSEGVIHSGIDFDGMVNALYQFKNVGKVSSAEDENGEDSDKSYPFPGFRKLSKEDLFVEQNPFDNTKIADATHFTVSNLKISFVANVCYGVYGREVMDDCFDSNVYSFDNVLGDDNAARKGELPLGLFAENLGTIENISLDRMVVRGLERVGEKTVYTNMVGGFAGNNIGIVKNLAILDSPENELETTNVTEYFTSGGKTHINGRTDVGGIIGRESFVPSGSTDRNVTLDGLVNYGRVTGFENIGGIVGRAYVHYIGDDKNISSEYSANYYDNNSRKEYYKDGYTISETGKSMSGADVDRAFKITISNSRNRGRISGDSIIYKYGIDDYQIKDIENENQEFAKIRHCAFIGGIAGITQDGFMIDSRDIPLSVYNDFFAVNSTSEYINVENCSSCTLYPESDSDDNAFNDIEGIIDSINTKADNKTEYKPFTCDYYVGGLIGYSRLTAIKNCTNNPDASELKMANTTDMRPYVFGSRYVGGMVGCSDFTRYDKVESISTEKNYACTNDANVIGRLYVGGIAGAFGLGSGGKDTFSFKEPSKSVGANGTGNYNNNAIVSKYANSSYGGLNKNTHGVSDLLNKGVVLGIKSQLTNNKLDYVSDVIYDGGKKYCYGITGFVGGIAGQISTPLNNCDNIQTQQTKEYMLNLISKESASMNDGENDFILTGDITADTIAKIMMTTKFGGNCVGGIVGYVNWGGSVNGATNNTTHSEIDAVVFGENIVGGGTGSYIEKNNQMCYNLTPVKKEATSSGMTVIGNDLVGGLIGMTGNRGYNSAEKNNTIEDSYRVIGRYSVGGFAGMVRGDKADQSRYFFDIHMSGDDKVVVKAVAAAGGIAGCIDNWDQYSILAGRITGVQASARIFSGGYVGLLGKRNQVSFDDTFRFSDDIYVDSSNIEVGSAESSMCGGIAGTYMTYTGKYISFPIETETNTCDYMFADYMNSLFYSESNGTLKYRDASEASSVSLALSILNNDLDKTNETDNLFKFVSDNSHEADCTAIGLGDGSTVTASVAAGGLFGYLPERTHITIKNFENNISVNTNYTIGSSNISEIDGNKTLSYLGGVVGRVPSNTKLLDCKNNVSTENASYPQYKAANGVSYIGGLAEVNAGTIEGTVDTTEGYKCINTTVFTNETGGVGAFAGIVGTKKSKGVIKNVSNTVDLSGKYVGGIAATAGGEAEIIGCINHGELNAFNMTNSSDAGAAGILYDVMPGVTDDVKITECINTGVIRVDRSAENEGFRANNSAGIVYNTHGTGIINLCRNYGTNLKNGITSSEVNTDGTNDKRAQKIYYSFDASNSNNHIGEIVRPDDSYKTNMYMNFYIGRSSESTEFVDPGTAIAPSTKFVAYRDYGTMTLDSDWVMEYDINDSKRKSISELVFEVDPDKYVQTYYHNTKSQWALNDGNEHLGFTVFPANSNEGVISYANMNKFSVVWDDYERTEHDEFYKYVDEPSFNSYVQEFNGEAEGSKLNLGEITTSLNDVLENEYDNPANFRQYVGYDGNLKNNFATKDYYRVYAENVYLTIIKNEADSFNALSISEKKDYYRTKIYKSNFNSVAGNIQNVIDRINNKSGWYPGGFEYYVETHDNGTFDTLIAGLNETVTETISKSYYQIAYDEYNNLTDNDLDCGYADNYLRAYYGQGGSFDMFIRYANSLYGYIKDNNVLNFNTATPAEKEQIYLQLLYEMNEQYSERDWNDYNLNVKIVYDLIVTSVNANDSSKESKLYIKRVDYNNTNDQNQNMHIATFNFNDLDHLTDETYTDKKVSDNGFSNEYIKNIQVIVRENNTGNVNKVVGIKALLWSGYDENGNEINETVMDSAETNENSVYETAKDTEEVVDIIKSNCIATAPFVVDKEIDETPNYQLRLVYNSSKYNTGIDEIKNHPLDSSESGYLSDVSRFSDTCLRNVMYMDMDEKYCGFIDLYD